MPRVRIVRRLHFSAAHRLSRPDWSEERNVRTFGECAHHRNLNLDVPWLADVVPTTENLAIGIWKRISPHIPPPAVLDAVIVQETPRNRVEYRGG